MKKKLESVEAFKNGTLDLNQKSNIRGGEVKLTGGYSRPATWSSTGCVTYSSDYIKDDGTLVGENGKENLAY